MKILKVVYFLSVILLTTVSLINRQENKVFKYKLLTNELNRLLTISNVNNKQNSNKSLMQNTINDDVERNKYEKVEVSV